MKIEDYRDKYKGKRCYILGNGPSLRDVDLDQLKKEYTFGTNRIYLSGFTPRFYVAVNPLVIEQFWDEITRIEAVRFLPDWALNSGKLDYAGKDLSRTVGIDTSWGMPAFSSPEGPMWEGHTVTYVCLQLAHYMGFDEVILLGIDHDYGAPKRANLEAVATGPDVNHFDPAYFSNGVRWNYPDLARSEVAYSLARAAFDKVGRRVVNCSSRTKLDVFERLPLNYVLDGERVRVSCLVSAYKCGAVMVADTLVDIKNQSEAAVEAVVVCQEGSAEHKAAAGFKLLRNDLDITVVTTANIPTVYGAWNMAARAARGRYYTNWNTDDRRESSCLEICADILDGRADIDLVYPDVFVSWEVMGYVDFIHNLNGQDLKAGRWEGQPGYFSWLEYERGTLAKGCYIGPVPMWRGDLHQRHGYFIDNYKVAGDYEFWLRCAKENNYLHLPAFMGVYAARMDGLELGNPVQTAEESEQVMIVHQNPEGVEFALSGEYVRVGIGDEYVYANPSDVKRMVEKLLNGGQNE